MKTITKQKADLLDQIASDLQTTLKVTGELPQYAQDILSKYEDIQEQERETPYDPNPLIETVFEPRIANAIRAALQALGDESDTIRLYQCPPVSYFKKMRNVGYKSVLTYIEVLGEYHFHEKIDYKP